MRKRLILPLFAMLLMTSYAGETVMLSSAGRRRIAENVEILKSNKKELLEALEKTRKNLEVVQKELSELAQLEKEQISLKAKYRKYLDQAAGEVKKNQKAIRDLETWEKEHRSLASGASDAVTRSKMEAVSKELSDRLQWRADTDAKLAKVSTLAGAMEKNLRDIRSRREPLLGQVKSLERRRTDIENDIAQSSKRLGKLEEQLKVQQPSAAPEN